MQGIKRNLSHSLIRVPIFFKCIGKYILQFSISNIPKYVFYCLGSVIQALNIKEATGENRMPETSLRFKDCLNLYLF